MQLNVQLCIEYATPIRLYFYLCIVYTHIFKANVCECCWRNFSTQTTWQIPKKHVIIFVTLSVFDCFKSVKIMVFK